MTSEDLYSNDAEIPTFPSTWLVINNFYIYTSFSKNAIHQNEGRKPIKRLELLEKLVEMEKKAAQSSGDEAAMQYFQIGNALYNTDIWTGSGITWQSDTVDWRWDDYTVFRYIQPVEYPFNVRGFSTELHNRKTEICYEQLTAPLAMKYYEKAAAVAKDRELIARALFCAKATAARYRDFGMAMSNMPNEVNMGEDRFFRKLKDEYSDTQAFRELSAQCSYLADFQ